MTEKLCLYKRSDIDSPPTLVKCGNRRELNTYAMLKKGCKWKKDTSLFGGYFYDEEGVTYEFDNAGGHHEQKRRK